MKCKKLFALLLSVCMVLSTFVAVSAQEQVWDEGNVKTLVDLTKDFEVNDGMMLNGKNMSSATFVADPTNAANTVYGGVCDGTGTSYFGFKLPVNNVLKGDKVTVTMDIYSTVAFTTEDQYSTKGVLIRTGTSWAPSGGYKNTIRQKSIPAGEWITVTDTITVDEDLKAGYVYLQVRPNTATTIYVDDLSIKIEGARTFSMYSEEDFTDVSDVLKGGSVSSLTSVNDAVKGAVGSVTAAKGNGGKIGMYLLDGNGEKITTLANGTYIAWSVDLKLTTAMTTGDLDGLIIRNGDWPSAADGWRQLIRTDASSAIAIPAGKWVTLSGATKLDKDITASNGVAVGFRLSSAQSYLIDNLKVYAGAAATEVVEGQWKAPDYSTTVTASNVSKIGSAENGAFTYTIADVATLKKEGINDGTVWIRVIPETPIPVGTNWSMSVDLTSSDIVDSNNQGAIRLRTFDTTDGSTLANTISYHTQYATFNQTATYTFDGTDVSSTGNATGTSIASIGIILDVSGATTWDGSTSNTGSFTISNINLNINAKLNLSATKSADGKKVTLSIANGNDQKYKFAGRFFVAEYKDVDGTKQLVNFGAADNIAEEIAAGATATKDITFTRAIDANNTVKLFLWEPGSFGDTITELSL